MKENSIHLPGLNGLRAIAALSVVVAHISLKGIADFGLANLFDLQMSGYGVTLFFVISGFLITYLLLHELDNNGDVNIKKFYVRRILRIWPIYYLFLTICIGVFIVLGKTQEIILKEMWFYVFFAANVPFIFQQGIMILVHYWSIGVEEQFYLFWPWVVRISKNRLLEVTIIIFFILFVIKILFWWRLGTASFEYRFLSVSRFHCMMIGAIGGILYFKKQIDFVNLFSNRIVQLVSWSIFFLMGFNIVHIPPVIAQEVIAIAAVSMIIGQITVTKRLFNLENRVCDFIGKISYGIYVIHPLIILLLSRFFKNLNIEIVVKCILVYSTVVVFTIFVAWLSYNYFEKPFLKLKRKFSVVQSSDSLIF